MAAVVTLNESYSREVRLSDLRGEVFDWIYSLRNELANTSWSFVESSLGVNPIDAYISFLNVRLLEVFRGNVKPGILRKQQAPSTPFATAIRRIKSAQKSERWKYYFDHYAAKLLSGTGAPSQIVFWPVDYTHLQQQLPVASVLDEMGVRTVFVTNRADILLMLRKAGRKAIYSRAEWRRSIADAIRNGLDLGRHLAMKNMSFTFPCLAGLDSSMLYQEMKEGLRLGLPFISEAVTTTKSIIQDIDPDVLVVGNDLTLEGRTCSLLLRESKTRTASIMHGSIGGGEPLDREHIVDKFYVYGESSKNELIQIGNVSSSIEVTGAPYLDRKTIQSGQLHPKVKKEFSIAKSGRLVLLATSGPGHCTSRVHFNQLIKSVMELSVNLNEVCFVAKLHPKDNPENYRALQTEIPKSRMHIAPHGFLGLDIFEWLQGCSMLLTTTSTVGLEAILLQVPVISMDFLNEYRDIDYIDAGATIHVTTPDELKSGVEAILQAHKSVDSASQRSVSFRDRAFFRMDDRASERVARAVLQLADA